MPIILENKFVALTDTLKFRLQPISSIYFFVDPSEAQVHRSFILDALYITMIVGEDTQFINTKNINENETDLPQKVYF